jgi:hypothetical protein
MSLLLDGDWLGQALEELGNDGWELVQVLDFSVKATDSTGARPTASPLRRRPMTPYRPVAATVTRPASDPRRRAVRSGPDPWAASRSAQAYFARARRIGTAVGIAARSAGRVDPDRLWVARQLLGGRLEAYDRAIDVPATRSADDELWVQLQLDKRDRYVRTGWRRCSGSTPRWPWRPRAVAS